MNYDESTKLRILELRHERVRSYPSRESCADLDLSLYQVTNDLETSTSTEAHIALANYWLKRLEVHFDKPDISTFLAYDLHRCLEQCAVHGVLSAILKDRDATNLLACACLLSVSTHSTGNRGMLVDSNIRAFVSNWPVESATQTKIDSMQAAVAFFYGAHVWDLCGAEGATDEDLIQTIWSMHLPTTNMENTAAIRPSENQNLPNDFH